MGIKRIVDVSFWTDGKVDEFSPEDKYFLLYLLTNPFTKQLGIYEISIKQAAFQMGYSIDAFKVLLERFENKYKMILFSSETNEVAILNFLRHSVMKGGKPVEDCIRKEMSLVKNKNLINFVFSHLYGRDDLNETVKKIVDEYIIKNEIQNDNDNENERTQGVSLDESLHDSCDLPSEPPKTPEPENEPTRETIHTIFKRILPDYNLSSKLQERISDWLTYKIERRESYKEMGLKSLLRQIENNASQYGDDAVCQLIEYCMACNWAGIIFDRLKQKTQRTDNYASSNRNDGHSKEVQSKWGTVGIDL